MKNLFEPYKIPLFKNGVRLPEIKIKAEDKTALGLSENASNEDYLKKLTWLGCLEKIKSGKFKQSKEECAARLKMEFEVFRKTGTIDYLLLLMDIFLWCDKNNVARGVGRGSAAGSLTLAALNLISINPLDHNLNFTRFLNEARAKTHYVDKILHVDGKSFADFDGDVSFLRRQDTIRRIEKDYEGKTCKILTLQYLTSKMSLKDTVKSFLEYDETSALAIGGYIESLFGKVDSLDKTYEKNKEFKEWADNNKEAYLISKKIEGLLRGAGQHASGLLINYYNLEDTVPTELAATEEVISGFDMGECATISLKADLLGLRTCDTLQLTAEQVGIKYTDINIHSPEIYQYLATSDKFYGLFQIEDGLTKEVVKRIHPKNIDQLAACLSISRPGALSGIGAFESYVKTGEPLKLHPEFDKILEPTGGQILYQETINAICQSVYKMSATDADEVRRCISGDTMFVSKTRGWISINRLLEEGYLDDLFLIMDEKGKQKWAKISKIWSNGLKTVHFVTSKTGLCVKATKDHQFLTDKGWKRVHHLSPNDDHFVCAKQIEYEGTDYISKDLSIVIAGMLTEGYCNNKQLSGHFTNYDPEVMEKFRKAFFNVFGEESSLNECGRVTRLLWRHATYLNKYMSWGLSRTKRIPEKMMGMTKETTREFLGFMFTGEVGITESSKHIEYSSASEKMVKQIQLLLLRFGIKSALHERTVKGYEDKGLYYRLYILGYSNQKKFRDEIGPFLCSTKQKQLGNILVEERALYHEEEIPQEIIKKFRWQYGQFITTRENRESGRWYTGKITKKCLLPYIEESKNKYWIDWANGQQIYDEMEPTPHTQKEIEVYDFSMENSDEPYIIANGMVIHNCIGKKDTEGIKKWEPVIERNGKENNIPQEVTDKFWATVKSSADYLFNANHCYSYSYITAYTTYFKAKYPAQFFLACLKMSSHESDPIDCISKIKSELPYFNITLQGPDILRSSDDFTLNGNTIIMGLGAVKGVSGAALEKIKSFRATVDSRFSLYLSLQNSKIPLNVITSLFLAGAFDSVKGDISRNALLMHYEIWNELTPRELPLINNLGPKFGYDLIEILKQASTTIKDEKGKFLIKESRLNTLRTKTKPYILKFNYNERFSELTTYLAENYYLGFSYSHTLKGIYSKHINNLLSLKELRAATDRRDPYICVVQIGEVEKRTSKNKKDYIKYTLKDDSDSLAVMDFQVDSRDGKTYGEGVIAVFHIAKKKTETGDFLYFVNDIVEQEVPTVLKTSVVRKELEEKENEK